MVGLDEFGEAAWPFEMLLTQWEDESRESMPQFWTLISQALEAFADWIECIALNRSPPWNTEIFQIRANAMLQEQRLIPFDLVQGQSKVEREAEKVPTTAHSLCIAGFESLEAADSARPNLLQDEPSQKFPEEFFDIFLTETGE